MTLIEFNLSPTHRQLRQFGAICLVALPLLGWFWSVSALWISVLTVIGMVLAITGILVPSVLKPLFIALSLVATPIGMIFGELAMLLIYFGVFLPLGLIFRVIGRDALQIKRHPAKTYWQPVKKTTDVASYYRQS